MDVRRIAVIFVIAVLFAIFVFTMIEAVYPEPQYEDFCQDAYADKPYPVDTRNCSYLDVPDDFRRDCTEKDGRVAYEYDQQGCQESYYCEMCHAHLDEARELHNMVTFLIAAILGLVAIALALYLPIKNDINEWIGTGFMLGGLFTLFFGTARYFGDMVRFVRPVVIFIELLIIIYLTYRKLGKK